jgi:hypothetical protein
MHFVISSTGNVRNCGTEARHFLRWLFARNCFSMPSHVACAEIAQQSDSFLGGD